MSTFPGAMNFQKGAIVGFDIYNPVSSVVVFQYNPETVTRTLAPSSPSGESREDVLRLAGPPKESISLTVRLNAADQLETQDSTVTSMGLYPQLSALEMLLYPKSALVLTNAILAAIGTIELLPTEGPFTLLIWGAKRVVPVRLTSFSITEKQWDPNLNPTQADVELGMDVLTYNDFQLLHPGWALFMAHQVVKEAMAVVGSIGNISALAGGSVKIL